MEASRFLFLVLGCFFVWETVRYAFETIAENWFSFTRVFHPLVVLGISFAYAQSILYATAVAGAVGILHILVDKIGAFGVAPVQFRRPRRGGLPPLP